MRIDIINLDNSIIIKTINQNISSAKVNFQYTLIDNNTILKIDLLNKFTISSEIDDFYIDGVQLSVRNIDEQIKKLSPTIGSGGGSESVYEFSLNTTSYEITDADIINNTIIIPGAISTKDGSRFNNFDIDNLPSFFNGKVDILTENRLMFNLNPVMNLIDGSYSILLKQKESNIEQTITIIYKDYVEVNGIKWARTNLVADSTDSTGMTSKFARHSSDYGSLYQWGRKQAWKVGLPNVVTGLPTTNVTGTVWPSNEDPSPSGWRLPTADDFESLYNNPYIKVHELSNSVGNIASGFFVGGVNYNEATMLDSKGCVFLPIGGYRNSSGQMLGLHTYMYYWSSSVGGSGNAQSYYLNQNWNTSAPTISNAARSAAYSLRLVKI